MIIRDALNNIIKDVPLTKEAEYTQQLMQSDEVTLSWNDTDGTTLPVGAYIVYNSERYALLEPHTPTQKTENSWLYEPVFKSKVMAWAKIPFFMYTRNASDVILTREPDWSLTAELSQFCARIADVLTVETGERWLCQYDVALVGYKTLTFNSTDVLSALNTIASEWETEWWVDKATRTIHIGTAKHGSTVALTVGVNVGVPSVTANKDGYYNRFYIFGSTRNITQDYRGANVNSLINKRLTLNPSVYPNGYIDTEAGLTDATALSKVLVFEGIYPKSNLRIKSGSLRTLLAYRLNEQSERIQIGTDNNAQPVYDQYAVWFFKLCDRTTGADFHFVNETYGADHPDGMLMPEKNPSAHFDSGALVGQDFELIYHEDRETLKNFDGTPITIDAGSFEIKFKEENGLIIPSILTLCPAEGDNVILFNVAMPADYIASAQAELLVEAQKEIEKTYTVDNNNYEVKSNQVAFCESDPALSVGRRVQYTNGSQTLETRVIKVVKKLATPWEQTITIGNQLLKGNTATLKEEVATANKDINVIASVNEMTSQISQSYNRAQQAMAEGFAQIKDMWVFDPNDPTTIYSRYNVYTEGYFSAFGKAASSGGASGGGVDLTGYYTKTEVDRLLGAVSVDLSGYYNRGDVDGLLSGVVRDYGNSPGEESAKQSGLYYTYMAGGQPLGDGAVTGMSVVAALAGQYGWQLQGHSTQGRLHVRGLYAGEWREWHEVAFVSDIPTSMAWSAITSKPTTLGGYGIADAYSKEDVNGLLSGYYTRAQTDVKLSGYYTRAQTNAKLSGYLALTGGTLSGELTVNDNLSSRYLSTGHIDCSGVNAEGDIECGDLGCADITSESVSTDGAQINSLDVYQRTTIRSANYECVTVRRTQAGTYGAAIRFDKSDGTKLGDAGFDGNNYFQVRNHLDVPLLTALCVNGNVGVGTASPLYKLDVAGTMRVAGKRIYFGDASHYIELDTDGNFHFSHGVYSDEFVSAFGKAASSGGSGEVNLTNYYTKGEVDARTYTKGEIDDMLSGYMPSGAYVTTTMLGGALSGYVQTAQLNATLQQFASKDHLTHALTSYATKAYVADALAEYTTDEHMHDEIDALGATIRSEYQSAIADFTTQSYVTQYVGAEIADALRGYLPLSGGHVTGQLRVLSLTADQYVNAGSLEIGASATIGTTLAVGTDLTVASNASVGSTLLVSESIAVQRFGAVNGMVGLRIEPNAITLAMTSALEGSQTLSLKSERTVGMNTVTSYAAVRAGAMTVSSLLSEGYVTAYGTASASDSRLKCAMEDVSLDVSAIASAPLVTHGWVGRKELPRSVGTIAQYWRAVLPEAVTEGEWLYLDYGKLATACAISMAREVERLRSELNELKTKICQ